MDFPLQSKGEVHSVVYWHFYWPSAVNTGATNLYYSFCKKLWKRSCCWLGNAHYDESANSIAVSFSSYIQEEVGIDIINWSFRSLPCLKEEMKVCLCQNKVLDIPPKQHHHSLNTLISSSLVIWYKHTCLSKNFKVHSMHIQWSSDPKVSLKRSE
jgi:hypothetical protein